MDFAAPEDCGVKAPDARTSNLKIQGFGAAWGLCLQQTQHQRRAPATNRRSHHPTLYSNNRCIVVLFNTRIVITSAIGNIGIGIKRVAVYTPHAAAMSLSSASSVSRLSIIDEKIAMLLLPPSDLMVRDFGWPSASPRYRGDHTQESNPDWDHDPLECATAKEEAFQKMEKSYALYMANLSGPRAPVQKKPKEVWQRFLPRWMVR